MTSGLGIKSLAKTVVPYPTLGDASRRAAVNYYARFATNPWARRVMDMVAKLG
jgi:hypothetical protein